MFALRLPNKTSDSINKMFRAFWWGKNEGKRNIHTIKWAELCRPISKGGLGIRDNRSNNLTLLVKTYWRCLSNEKLRCSKVLKANKCYPRTNLWEAQYRKGNSSFWKKFVEEVNFINEKVEWIIGNGKGISVWNHNWILCKNSVRKPFFSMINASLKVKDLWNLNKEWNINVLKDLFNNPIDIEDIFKIYIPKSIGKDEKVWPFSKSGHRTTKSAYRVIYNNK